VQDPAGVAAGPDCTAEGPNSAICEVANVVIASGDDGDDTIVFTYTPGVAAYDFVRLFGEAGDDTIRASSETQFVFGGSGNDRIDGGAGADYIECGDGIDGVVDDPDDLQVNECEASITLGGGGGGGTGGPGGLAAAATIRGGKSAGTVKVSSSGSFRLKRQVVECPAGGARCKVRTSVTGRVSASAKKRTVKLGGSSYSIAAGKKGAVRVKLTKKGLRLLRRSRKAKGTITIRVTKGSTVTTKKVSVTLRAPKKR
jgi:Ca2+-binding RTX toxin-like protein